MKESAIYTFVYSRSYWLTMRALHRLNLCWMQSAPLRSGDNGQWINVRCSWCGVQGQRLDMARAMIPNAPKEATDA